MGQVMSNQFTLSITTDEAHTIAYLAAFIEAYQNRHDDYMTGDGGDNLVTCLGIFFDSFPDLLHELVRSEDREQVKALSHQLRRVADEIDKAFEEFNELRAAKGLEPL